MALTEVRLPALGEGITEATITRWLVKAGDVVTADTPLVEIATDKVDTEVISPVDGTVGEILFQEQAVPKIGEILVYIQSGKEEELAPSPVISNTLKAEARPYFEEKKVPLPTSGKTYDHKFIPPFIRYLAVSEGITPEELNTLAGTGVQGVLTKDDILNYILTRPVIVKNIQKPGPVIQQVTSEENQSSGEISLASYEEAVPMDRVRKLIAKNMVESKKTAPHVTVFSEVDITPIVEWRNKNKQLFQQRYQEHLTYTPIFVECVARALLDFPGINISVREEYIIRKSVINIGMAVALPDGNLIVPVVKNADRLNLGELAHQVNDLSSRARAGKLKPVDIQEGTFTITNIGSFGNISGTPIINLPQAAILAIGTITKKPAVVDNQGTLGIGIRDMMTLSLSFDHRAVDGAMGGSFLQRVCQYLGDFKADREV